ncbi:MAG: NUDIX domain-containing protein [PVC group bacterium]|nr:NUDIX domain-containing protein [PVC group bacterium]
MTERYNFTSINLTKDKYDGITLDNASIPNDVNAFEKELINIIENTKDKKLLWVKLPIEKSHMIPLLSKYKFVFHHCNETDITMFKKPINNSIMPPAVNHTIGVGAVVIDDHKLLVIKSRIWRKYSLPGGHINDKETISQALQREVLEETGIKIELDSIVSLGHFPQFQFEKANMYIVCSAKALSKEISIVDSHEIIEAKWMDVDEYLNCEDVHIYNKHIVKTALKNKGLKLENYNYFGNSESNLEYYF